MISGVGNLRVTVDTVQTIHSRHAQMGKLKLRNLLYSPSPIGDTATIIPGGQFAFTFRTIPKMLLNQFTLNFHYAGICYKYVLNHMKGAQPGEINICYCMMDKGVPAQ